jgi:hypothetical protein
LSTVPDKFLANSRIEASLDEKGMTDDRRARALDE